MLKIFCSDSATANTTMTDQASTSISLSVDLSSSMDTAASNNVTVASIDSTDISLRRTHSTGDLVWLTAHRNKKPASLMIGDDLSELDKDLSLNLKSLDFEDNFGALTFSISRQSRWRGTANKVIHPVLEEGSSDDSSIGTATVHEDLPPSKPRGRKSSMDAQTLRGSGQHNKPKCSQSVMMRWLASNAVPPGSKLPEHKRGPDGGEDPCKNFKFSFKSRDLNAVSPSNWWRVQCAYIYL